MGHIHGRLRMCSWVVELAVWQSNTLSVARPIILLACGRTQCPLSDKLYETAEMSTVISLSLMPSSRSHAYMSRFDIDKLFEPYFSRILASL